MKKFIILLLLIPSVYACKTIQPASKQTLFTIEGQPVSNEEFLFVYQKNNFNDTLPPKQSVDHYLALFINFKLKVAEARSQGIHNTQQFIQEFNTYKEQLMQPYLQEKNVTEQLVNEAYERLQQEVNASHILIKLPSPAMPEDTLRVYRQLEKIRQRILQGEDFGEMARKYSDDPSAASNNGNLGYFSALQMIYPFEDQAYQTSVGNLSKPFRTQYGYHVLKVNDKRPAQGEIKVSHLMVRATAGISEEDSINAVQKINQIHQQLKSGGDWSTLVQQYSDDLNTKNSGGALPWLSTGNVHPDFANAAFALPNPGAVSEPIKTPYGWHIIRLEDKKELQPLSEMEAKLRAKIEKDSRSQLGREYLVNRLKRENQFEDKGNLNLIQPDSALVKGDWQPSIDSLQLVDLFSINKETYTQNDFYDFILHNQKPQQNITANYYLQLLYDQFIVEKLIAYEKAHLTEKYPEYRMLLKEYEEGILLFQLMDEEIWTKASTDSTGLKEYFNANKSDYQWNERADVTILKATDKETLEKALSKVDNQYYEIPNQSYDIDENTNLELLLNKISNEVKNFPERHVFIYSSEDAYRKISSYFLERSVPAGRLHFESSESPKIDIKSKSKKALSLQLPNLVVEEGQFEKDALPVLNEIAWMPGIEQLTIDGYFYHIEVKKILKPAPKQLNEIKGKVISDYQDYLEKNWVAELKQKYSVVVNENARKQIYKLVEK